MNLTQILLNRGFIDWAGDPGSDNTIPKILGDNYTRAVQLYQPDEMIIHVKRKGVMYVTTYIPMTSFTRRLELQEQHKKLGYIPRDTVL